MRLIIAGSRDLTDPLYIDMMSAAIAQHGWNPSRVLSGRAKGIDTLGEIWARENDVEVEPYPADWNLHGKAAGPIRNRQMAENADALLLIRKRDSRGSLSMLNEANRLGILVIDIVV